MPMKIVSSRGGRSEVDGRPRVILVAGAAGFIGSHLIDRLLAEGHRVIGVDNFVTGKPANIAHLKPNRRFRFIYHDTTEPLRLDAPLDWIMHFASPASPPKYLNWPIETLLANSLGTWRLLELARDAGAKFLLASTSEVYGDALEHPQAERYWGNVNPIGPRSVYDEAKRYAEAMTASYHREFRLPVRIIRVFNTYGARMDPWDGRVVTNFVRQALNDEALTVYGDGEQTRSLQHVSDLVEGIVRLMDIDYPYPLNLGNPDEYRVMDIARLVIERLQSDSTITYAPLPADDPHRRQPDITAARAILHWEPKVPFRDGLADVVANIRATLGARQREAGSRPVQEAQSRP
jgi:nucleoside-diphosphate-sugar epimerase